MREWATTTTDGLHLSIGAGTEADAHIDKQSPTNKPVGGESQMPPGAVPVPGLAQVALDFRVALQSGVVLEVAPAERT